MLLHDFDPPKAAGTVEVAQDLEQHRLRTLAGLPPDWEGQAQAFKQKLAEAGPGMHSTYASAAPGALTAAHGALHLAPSPPRPSRKTARTGAGTEAEAQPSAKRPRGQA